MSLRPIPNLALPPLSLLGLRIHLLLPKMPGYLLKHRTTVDQAAKGAPRTDVRAFDFSLLWPLAREKRPADLKMRLYSEISNRIPLFCARSWSRLACRRQAFVGVVFSCRFLLELRFEAHLLIFCSCPRYFRAIQGHVKQNLTVCVCFCGLAVKPGSTKKSNSWDEARDDSALEFFHPLGWVEFFVNLVRFLMF